MTTRKIVIESCGTCPHRDHKGAFGAIGYIPKCGKTNRELPYTLVMGGTNKANAQGTGVIPDWCPLEVDNG